MKTRWLSSPAMLVAGRIETTGTHPHTCNKISLRRGGFDTADERRLLNHRI